eukprot:CAMPEP_0113671650 /NCGR_PEP_ID=MMETSP0038_2-20120614/5819_1 /TAXON_ID=2898 /ORGANISM="Cryptomonas paramecium" /LENGTH=214 /DNA_ID=CAMNT_0000587819 /DNA_START=439 /DNA_END=1080 /DNA_ORIENTATION=+ /assembly_acc=CAM_ASM_000170
MTDGRDFVLYFEEEIKSFNVTEIDSAGSSIAVVGSGFSVNRTYQCFMFGETVPLPTVYTNWTSWVPVQRISTSTVSGFGFSSLTGFPFTVLNSTTGTCTVNWPFESSTVYFTMLRPSPVFDTLMGSPQGMQPFMHSCCSGATLAGGTERMVAWASSVVSTVETVTGLSTYFGTATGGETMLVLGGGFRSGRAYAVELFTSDVSDPDALPTAWTN